MLSIRSGEAAMPAVTDHMIYLVFESSKTGPELIGRKVADLDRKTTVRDIADGQFKDICQVLECNPAEGICHDVTEDIASDVCDAWAVSGDALSDWQIEFVQEHRGIVAANSFSRAA